MIWSIVNKDPKNKPLKGIYSDWKQELANECNHKCVYCSITEKKFGSIRNFHVEHYRPKGLEKFKALENEWSNLYFACSICNCFKSDDWPNEPNTNLDINCYPDPSNVDYNDIFKENKEFEIEGLNIASRYLVNKIYLNRPQLILERRESHLKRSLKNNLSYSVTLKKRILESNIDKETIINLLVKIDDFKTKLGFLLLEEGKVIPHTLEQYKK